MASCDAVVHRHLRVLLGERVGVCGEGTARPRRRAQNAPREPSGGARLESRRGSSAGRRVRLGHGRPDRPARVPGDDAARGFRLPRRRRAPAVRAARAPGGCAVRARDRGVPRDAGREADPRRLQHRDGGRAAGAAGVALGAGRRRDRAGGARGGAGDAQPPDRAPRDRGHRRVRPVRGARADARRRCAHDVGRMPAARPADRVGRPVRARDGRGGARLRRASSRAPTRSSSGARTTR